MSRYDFLEKYAVEHKHYDPVKELHKHIDTEIMGNYPSRLVTTFAYNPHINADHISKVLPRWKFTPVAVIRAALANPASTQEHHQYILNQPSENIAKLADKNRFPTLVDKNVPKY